MKFNEHIDLNLIQPWRQNEKRQDKDKEHLTIVLCCNADGSNKLPLFVIGKYRYMKNINMNNLGVTYRANTKAWMTAVLFQKQVNYVHNSKHSVKF